MEKIMELTESDLGAIAGGEDVERTMPEDDTTTISVAISGTYNGD